MGYRLNVDNFDGTINYYYGTKHYGYSFIQGYQWDKECLKYPSYRYLKYLKKIDGFELWEYCCSPTIVLTARQFKHFITLYAKEWEEIQGMYRDWQGRFLLNDQGIKDALKDKGIKVLSWD